MYLNQGKLIGEGKKMEIGFTKCPAWLRRKYREAVNFTCQECHRNEEIVGMLVPHRLKRGNEGGLYTLFPLNHPNNNLKIVCSECHRKFHSNEFPNVQSSKIKPLSI
jgi:5-methylcytosine-specific restriction endonuclease McrA